jgi:hypothetical protein
MYTIGNDLLLPFFDFLDILYGGEACLGVSVLEANIFSFLYSDRNSQTILKLNTRIHTIHENV